MSDVGTGSTLRELTVDGARMRCLTAGSGDPLILLHGYPQSHLTWRHQIAPLAEHRHVIAPDLLGWGESQRPSTLRFDYRTEVRRLTRVFDALGVDSADVAAHDYGGFLGLGLAIDHPERVRRFAILNSRAHRTFSPAYYLLFGLLGVLGRRSALRPLLTTLPLGGMNRVALAKYRRQGCFDAQLIEQYVGWLDTADGRRWFARFFADYRVRARPELADGLAAIRCPTTVIWGDQDRPCPFAIAEDLAARIPDATLVRLRGADHYVMEQRPREVTAALVTWLTTP